MATETQIEAYIKAVETGLIKKSVYRVLSAAIELEKAGQFVTQEAIARYNGDSGGERRRIASGPAILKRRGAFEVIGKIVGERGHKVECYRVTGLWRDDPGPPPGRVTRENVVNYLSVTSKDDFDEILKIVHSRRVTSPGPSA